MGGLEGWTPPLEETATAVRPCPRFADARGTLIAFEGIRLLPTYHPAAVLYNRRLDSALTKDLQKVAELVREDRARMPRGGRLNAGSRGPSRGATRSGRRPR